MIRIDKNGFKPNFEFKQGQNKGEDKLEYTTNEIKEEYQKHKNKYDDGSKKFIFNSDIYGNKVIKEALKNAQNDKCCFCESTVSHISYGDVEHFRPKAAYKQNENDAYQYPGYFWLAYDWDNFMFSCQICNQRYKKNLFPLKNTSHRDVENQNIKYENPLLINPTKENPEDWIIFEKAFIKSKNNSKKGETTIKVLGLKRNELWEKRNSKYKMINSLIQMIEINPEHAKSIEAKKMLETDFFKIKAEYFGMIKANFEENVLQWSSL